VTALAPDNKVWARDLALAHIEASDIAHLRGDEKNRASHALTAERLIGIAKASGDSSLALKRLDAAIRLLISRSRPVTAEPDDAWDNALLDLERIANDSNGSIHATTLLAKALIVRGVRLARTGSTSQAHRDWERAIQLLEAAAKTSKDPDVIAPWTSAHLLLGHRQRVEMQISWLEKIGYRAPDYVAIVGDSIAATTDVAGGVGTVKNSQRH
jgi:tetratricopeptide (TPR) repeat protein